MAKQVILLDTSVLIDYYRKTNKANTLWVGLVRKGYSFAISTITKYEIYSGASPTQLSFWNKVLDTITVIPFDEKAAETAVLINESLKRKRKQIDIPDLFIAATALCNNLSIATLNRKHFERIDQLEVINSISATLQ